MAKKDDQYPKITGCGERYGESNLLKIGRSAFGKHFIGQVKSDLEFCGNTKNQVTEFVEEVHAAVSK